MICGKVIYKTMGEAVKAANGIKRQGKAYFCADCQGFHLYTQAKKNGKKKKKLREEPMLDTMVHPEKKFLIIHDPRKFKVK